MFNEEQKALITELGLQNFTEDEQAEQLGKFYSTLQMRVGMIMEDKLSDEQLLEFEKVAEAGDDQTTADWLKQAIPDYEEVVSNEKTVLTQEIKQSAAEYRAILSETPDPSK